MKKEILLPGGASYEAEVMFIFNEREVNDCLLRLVHGGREMLALVRINDDYLNSVKIPEGSKAAIFIDGTFMKINNVDKNAMSSEIEILIKETIKHFMSQKDPYGSMSLVSLIAANVISSIDSLPPGAAISSKLSVFGEDVVFKLSRDSTGLLNVELDRQSSKVVSNYGNSSSNTNMLNFLERASFATKHEKTIEELHEIISS